MNIPRQGSANILFAALILVTSVAVLAPLFHVKFFDEDDWYHLNFGRQVAENGMLGTNIFKMMVTEPEFATEEIRMLYSLHLYWAMNYKMWGKDADGHHLMAFILYLVSILAAFFITKRLTFDPVSAMIAAALFAWYPFQARPIGNATAVVYLLMTSTFLLTILFYLNYLRSGKLVNQPKIKTRLYFALTIFFFVVCIMTQEGTYALPAVLLIVDFVDSKKKTRSDYKKLLVRTGPFFLLLGALIVFTLGLAVTYKSTQNLEGRYLDFIGIPVWKLFTYVSEGFFTPFYIDSPVRNYLLVPAVALGIGFFVYMIFTFRIQNRRVLFFGLSWIVLTIAPMLQVLDRVIYPNEAEEKYLILPLFGFVLILSTIVRPIRDPGKVRRIAGSILTFGIAFVFLVGLAGNSRYFLDQGKKYERVLPPLQRAVASSNEQSVIVMTYEPDQQTRELMLAAILETTFDADDHHVWFFMDRARFVAIIDGLFPDRTAPDLTTRFDPDTGIRGQKRGTFKLPKFFSAMALPVTSDLPVMGMDMKKGFLVNVTPWFLKAAERPDPPGEVDLVEFKASGFQIPEDAAPAPGDVGGWGLIGNVYRVYPKIGRF